MKLDVVIAGASFRDNGVAIVTSVPNNATYRLEREPSNGFDKNAVQIWIDNHVVGRRSPKSYMLGYVPRKWSGTVSAALLNENLHVWADKIDNLWGTISIKWVNKNDDPL